jgi:uncharacterized protein YbaA (DUF1428 family)
MAYVDGFIVAVPKKNLEAYRRMSTKAGKIWREYGALDYREWVADDVKVGKVTSFPRSVKLKPGETVIFSWITYKSRKQRDRINAKVMTDKRLADMMNGKSMPFDGKRMIYGGFESLVKV